MSGRTFEELRQDVSAAMEISDPALLLTLADEIEAFGGHEAAAVAENARGVAYVFRGDFESALTHCHRALEAYKEIEHRVGVATVTGNIGNVYKIMGDYPHALEYLRRALDINIELGNRFAEASVIGNIGILYLNTSDYPQALEHFRRALEVQTELDSKTTVALLIGNIGNVYILTGDLPQALEHYQRALEMHRAHGDKTNEAVVTGNIGSVHASTGDHQQALTFFRQALELHTSIGATSAVASVLGSMCASLIGVGDMDAARQSLATLDTMQIDLPSTLISRNKIHARIAEIDGDVDAAADAYRQALEIAHDHSDRDQEADLHKALRDLAQKRNDFAAYIEHNNAYQRIFDEIRGQDATRKLAMIEAEQRIAAERAEKEKHKALLYNTLPPSIADRVLRGEVVNDAIDKAAVMFMDMVGFTALSSAMDPNDVVKLLSSIFSTCDAIMAEHGMMKIKTIGDSYMAAAIESSTVVNAAMAAAQILSTISEQHPEIRIRIGIHCGPVTAGVIGTERLQYDVWGDTVNVASRMESHGEPGRIHVSEAFANALLPSLPPSLTLQERGSMEVKGKGMMTTYWLISA